MIILNNFYCSKETKKKKKLTKRVIQWNTVNAMGIAGLNSKAMECISNK